MSFILTMWYVNNGAIVLFGNEPFCFILTMWYVNIEQVKEKLGTYASFILTMWYASFILTMWYVNFMEGKEKADNILEFYINYVVCKFGYRLKNKKLIIQFYINYVVCKLELASYVIAEMECFILTMWYVNVVVMFQFL